MPLIFMKLFNNISNKRLYKEFPNCDAFKDYLDLLLTELKNKKISINIIIQRGGKKCQNMEN